MTSLNGRGMTSITNFGGDTTGSEYIFSLNGRQPIFTLESLTFDKEITAGTFSVYTSPDNGKTWDVVPDGMNIDIISFMQPDRTKPSGRGVTTKVKITFDGVTPNSKWGGVVSQGVA
ncbi:MAG: hypothetical protein [Siphoviridae sp. ctdc_1]|nr:MAG: hypothetical protein [Siphoviridae sp. ctdc_1]